MKSLILSLALIAFACELQAQDSLGMRRSATLNYWADYTSDIEVIGNTAYVSSGGSGLHIMDFSNPAAPVETANIDSFAGSISVSDNRAYLDLGMGGEVWDISDPVHPLIIGSWLGRFGSIFVNGTVGVVTSDEGACPFALDVSDPESVHVVGDLLAPCYAAPVGVAGGFFGLIGFHRGFRLFDLSIPEQPTEVSSIFPTASFYDGLISGNYAYLVTGYAGTRIIDLTNPQLPIHVATFDSTVVVSNGIVITGNHAIVAEDSSLNIWNVADPASPAFEGSFTANEQVGNVHAWGNYACIASNYPSLTAASIIDISNPAAPVEVGSFGNRGDLSHMTVRDSLAYVADQVAGLRIIDVSDPAAPVELGHSGFGNFCCFEDVTIRGNYAYVAAENAGIVTVDVSSPAAPTVLSAWQPNYDIYWPRILAVGDYVYVADDNAVIYTFGLTNPTSPELVDTLNVGGWGRFGLAAYEGYLCAVNWDGFHILSLQNPASPEIAGSLIQDMGREITVSGHYAYVGGDVDTTRIVDLANPAEPLLVGQLPSPSRAVAARGNILVTTGAAGLKAWDISDPMNPQMVGYYLADEGSSYPWIDDAKILGNYAVTAGGYHLRTYECDALMKSSGPRATTPQSFALHPCYPNPFNSTTEIRFDLPKISPVDLTIFNTLGQKVATILNETKPAGRYQVQWNASGMASGLYICQIRAGSFVESRKMLLLR